ncbi:hypothetical protein CRUP_021535 [Coryphaenoides rupestris]|nr:hypothetical protein CRUP_021535 [Coryphaenoides rupestris]
MVIIFSKTSEKKGVNDVRCTQSDRLLRKLHAMSRGTTLFSRGTVARATLPVCCQSAEPVGGVARPVPAEAGRGEIRRGGNTPAITSLIRDLSLGDGRLANPPSSPAAAVVTHPAVVAPPVKRQCRSLSLSDDFASCRSSWRPQGSRVWTAVEKRRCHSGGSVWGGGGGPAAVAPGGHFPVIQRSFSFSLPSRSCVLSGGGRGVALELPCFTQGLAFQPLFTASPLSPQHPPPLASRHQDQDQDREHAPRQLSLSHEHISLSEAQTEEDEGEEASDASSPDSTPELGRRVGGLSRSRSQPCELNDKKIGMKRRRPEDAQEQRPSLDLAKMTQNLQTFESLSTSEIPVSPTSTTTTTTQWSPRKLHYGSYGNFTSVSQPGPGDRQGATTTTAEEEDSSYEEEEELDSGDSACSVGSRSRSPVDMEEEEEELEEEEDTEHTLWKGIFQGTQGGGGSFSHLGGELDLEQIERN